MKSKYIAVTGAAGFIASNLVRCLNQQGFKNLVLVDFFNTRGREVNLKGLDFVLQVERKEFPAWLETHAGEVEFVFHLGARTDTTEFNFIVLEELNLNYSKTIWSICTDQQIPLLYASSAATYGLGETGFSDDPSLLKNLRPLNPYGRSKQLFDLFVMEQKSSPPFWAGLKFFNVYGPHESEKGRMASVVFHAFGQIRESGKMKLFKSHRPDFKDGEQLRDFIYVDDITNICLFFFKNRRHPGIYNAGTGRARTFNDLAKTVFAALGLPPQIEYVPIPKDIREKYQYFTEANMERLRSVGYSAPFVSLEEGVEHYVQYLLAQEGAVKN